MTRILLLDPDASAGIRRLDGPIRHVDEVGDGEEDLLVDLACRAAAEDEADLVIPAGAPSAGPAGRVAHRIRVPVIDHVVAALRMAGDRSGVGRPSPV